MTKTNALLFLKIICFLALTGCKATESKIELFSITEQVAIYYKAQEDTELMGNIFFTSVYTTYRTPQTLFIKSTKPLTYQSKYETVMFDCLKKVFSAPDTIYYATNNVSGHEVYSTAIAPPEVQWLPIEKDPIYQRLFKKLAGICNEV